jgi:outer membrane protein TolC
MKWYPTALVGGKLILPIFSSGQKHFRVNQSKLSLQKAENDVKILGQALSLEQASARVRYQNAVLSMNAQKQNMALAQQVYEVSKIKYQEGVGSNLELLDAETQLKSAQTNYYNAVNQSLMAKIDMEQSKGNYEIK